MSVLLLTVNDVAWLIRNVPREILVNHNLSAKFAEFSHTNFCAM